MHHIFFIHLSVEGHLGCFQCLPVMKRAIINMVEEMSIAHPWKFSFVCVFCSGSLNTELSQIIKAFKQCMLEML